jgi:hypothetical protein
LARERRERKQRERRERRESSRESLLCWLAFAFTSGREECGAQNLWGTFGRASVLKLINSLSVLLSLSA